jgi:hypothetical protein
VTSELISSSKIGKALNRFVKDQPFSGAVQGEAAEIV